MITMILSWLGSCFCFILYTWHFMALSYAWLYSGQLLVAGFHDSTVLRMELPAVEEAVYMQSNVET